MSSRRNLRPMPAIVQLLTALLLLCLSVTAQAEKLRIVTEPWAPYVYEENGKMLGLDYETTAIVFKRLGIDVEWQFLPWKRCLAMLEQGLADGALDIFHSDERDALLLYPSEPLSDVEFVMFYANARPHPFRTLDDLGGLTVGTSPGYLYSQAFSESTLFKREAAPTHEANFGKVATGSDRPAHHRPQSRPTCARTNAVGRPDHRKPGGGEPSKPIPGGAAQSRDGFAGATLQCRTQAFQARTGLCRTERPLRRRSDDQGLLAQPGQR